MSRKRATILDQWANKDQSPLKQPYGLAFLNGKVLEERGHQHSQAN